MPTTRTLTGERALETAWRDGALPPLSLIDRAALAAGVHLILWGQRHAERADRAEQARRCAAAQQAGADRDAALERRIASGPTW